jgi:hypothetical protein
LRWHAADSNSTATSIENKNIYEKSMIMARGVYIGFSLSQLKRRSVRIPAAVRKAPIGELTKSILSTPYEHIWYRITMLYCACKPTMMNGG